MKNSEVGTAAENKVKKTQMMERRKKQFRRVLQTVEEFNLKKEIDAEVKSQAVMD